MIIVGFAGAKGSGKSAAADFLEKNCEFSRQSFAFAVKVMLMTGLGVGYENVYGSKKEEIIPWLGVSARRLMQTLGTEWGRDMVSTDLWVNVVKRRIELSRPEACIVIDDVRFENEAEMIRGLGGKIVQVSRKAVEPHSDAHRSEEGLDQKYLDGFIGNFGSLSDLNFTVLKTMSDIFGQQFNPNP